MWLTRWITPVPAGATFRNWLGESSKNCGVVTSPA